MLSNFISQALTRLTRAPILMVYNVCIKLLQDLIQTDFNLVLKLNKLGSYYYDDFVLVYMDNKFWDHFPHLQASTVKINVCHAWPPMALGWSHGSIVSWPPMGLSEVMENHS